MLRYAKSKRGSKSSKRKGGKNTGHPIPQWRRANPAFVTRAHIKGNGPAGEFITPGRNPERGHVHLAGCGCLSRAQWGDNYSDEYLASVASAKALARRIAAHETHGAKCPVHFTLLPLSGECVYCS